MLMISRYNVLTMITMFIILPISPKTPWEPLSSKSTAWADGHVSFADQSQNKVRQIDRSIFWQVRIVKVIRTMNDCIKRQSSSGCGDKRENFDQLLAPDEKGGDHQSYHTQSLWEHKCTKFHGKIIQQNWDFFRKKNSLRVAQLFQNITLSGHIVMCPWELLWRLPFSVPGQRLLMRKFYVNLV